MTHSSTSALFTAAALPATGTWEQTCLRTPKFRTPMLLVAFRSLRAARAQWHGRAGQPDQSSTRRQPADGYHRPLRWLRWTLAFLADGLVDVCLLDAWSFGLVQLLTNPWELLAAVRPAAQPPLESIRVIVAALLDDQAECQRLLMAAEPLSDLQRADLVFFHQRMIWMISTYLAWPALHARAAKHRPFYHAPHAVVVGVFDAGLVQGAELLGAELHVERGQVVV
jgi:hypothetical protein